MLYLYEKNLEKSLAITLVGSGRVDSVTPIIELKKDVIFIERKTDFSLQFRLNVLYLYKIINKVLVFGGTPPPMGRTPPIPSSVSRPYVPLPPT